MAATRKPIVLCTQTICALWDSCPFKRNNVACREWDEDGDVEAID